MKVYSSKVWVLLLLCCSGCLSTPEARYYTLDMQSSGKAATTMVNLEVERIQVTEALARTDILIKKSATEIEYYALDRWAARLDELLAEKLQAEFGPTEAKRDTYLVRGKLLACEQVDTPAGAMAHVKLALVVQKDRNEVPVLKKVYEAHKTADAATAAAVVRALSVCVEDIAATLVEDIQAL